MKLKCPKCGSERVGANDRKVKQGQVRMKCKEPECKTVWFVPESEAPRPRGEAEVIKFNGITGDELKARHHMETIVQNTLDSLPYDEKGIFFTYQQIVEMTGLPLSKPGLKDFIHSKTDYYGKTYDGNNKEYFSHPDTIKEFKETRALR